MWKIFLAQEQKLWQILESIGYRSARPSLRAVRLYREGRFPAVRGPCTRAHRWSMLDDQPLGLSRASASQDENGFGRFRQNRGRFFPKAFLFEC